MLALHSIGHAQHAAGSELHRQSMGPLAPLGGWPTSPSPTLGAHPAPPLKEHAPTYSQLTRTPDMTWASAWVLPIPQAPVSYAHGSTGRSHCLQLSLEVGLIWAPQGTVWPGRWVDRHTDPDS